MAKRKGIRKELAQIAPSGQTLERQLDSLLEKKQYTKAIRKLQQSLKREPSQTLGITEADIWLQQGKNEFEQSRYPQAERSFRQAMTLGPAETSHYWLAKALLAQEQKAKALDLFRATFEDKTLPKNLGGCYLKLLFLNGEIGVVETLIQTKSSRFYAPHLHWARGILALKAEDPETALTHFNKMGRQASPGDNLLSWTAFAHQCAGQWSKAETNLGLNRPWLGVMRSPERRSTHPALQRLSMLQLARGQRSERTSQQWSELRESNLPEGEETWVLELLSLIHDGALHDAAHLTLDLPSGVKKRYPELQTLFRPLMLLGGNQAFQEQSMACAAEFWESVVQKPAFDPKLASRLHQALNASGAHRRAQRLLNQFLSWVQKEAKRTPEDWPETKLKSTQATLYCWLADQQMISRNYREAEQSVNKAAQLAPNSPDVIGRKGLHAFTKGNSQSAIPLLTQSLELGCQYPEIYRALVDLLEEEGDSDKLKSMRRKFGQQFGDVGVETEVDIPAWIEALSLRNYEIMADFVWDQDKQTPALEALEIFLDAAEDDPSSSQKITLNQAEATPLWDELLSSHPPSERVDILMAIYLVIHQHARRNKKGITALQSLYSQQIFDLIPEVPRASVAHLTLLPLKKLSPDRFAPAVRFIMQRDMKPGNTLALAHLALNHIVTNRMLGPFIDEQLEREPQNPLLLLAKATLYPPTSRDYQTYYDQGFELARRLQDASALNAFREEDWFKAQDLTRQMMGSRMGSRDALNPFEMVDMLKQMAEKILGQDVPPELIEQLIPELQDQMPTFYRLDDEEEDFDPIFLPPPKTSNRAQKKRKRWFEL